MVKKKLAILAVLIIIFDRAIKLLIARNLLLDKVNYVIDNFFYLTFVKNKGAGFSILSGERLLLITIAVITLCAFYQLFIKDKKLSNYETISYGLLVGGIISNLIDRVYFGYVIDYLGFIIFNYQFPIFNLADMAIVTAVGLISLRILKEGETNV